MANEVKFIQEGNILDVKVTDPVSYMSVMPLSLTTNVALGVGVACEDIAAGAVGAVSTKGVYEFPAVTAAMNFGDQVYWDNTNKKITKTATNNTPAGMVVQDKASGATAVRVKIG